MSLELLASLVCDICGAQEVSEVESRFTAGSYLATRHKRSMEKVGWMTINRGRYHREAHCCPSCIDKPLPKLKGTPRWKGPEVSEVISGALQPLCLIPDNHSVWVLIENEKRLSIGSPCKMITEEKVWCQWQIRYRKKIFQRDQITGWIGNKELVAILGRQPTL